MAGHAAFCLHKNVTYDHRVFDPVEHNWCAVPGGGADSLLFAGLAVFCACALYSRLSAVWVLLAGGVFQTLSFYYNLGHFSNAVTIWLGMHPSTIFFQIFLPPLLLDSAVRVDFFLFKKMAIHCLCFAFVNVVVSTIAFIPVLLHGLNLASLGWRAVDAALFGSMLGSTDAVAVTAILKAGGAPELLSALLEGESLFNDASSIVLFEIFLHMSTAPDGGGPLGNHAWTVLRLILWLAASGAVAGIAAGFLTKLLLKLLQRRSVPPSVEVAVSLAGAYTVYLCTEYYIHGSGVIAVVVYGLYGAASFLYGFSSKGMRTGVFFHFWDVVSFVTNGMVFFFVGASVMNFFLTIDAEQIEGGTAGAVLTTLRTMPGILAAMFLLRWLLMMIEAPFLSLVGPALSWQDVLFSAIGGLRGGLALILAQTVLAGHDDSKDERIMIVHSQMATWTACVVLFTLTVNAPFLGPLMTWLGLNKTTPAQRHMHRHAFLALAQYTERTIADLQEDDDEMLRGVDWKAVAEGANLGMDAKRVLKSSNTARRDPGAAAEWQLAGGARTSADGGGGAGGGGRRPSVDSGSARSMDRSASIPLTRKSLSQLSASGARLGAPLLGRQAGGPGRYGAAAEESDDDEGWADVEAGRQPGREKGAPPVVAESSSEAIFIANQLQAQEAALAKHVAEGSDCPFMPRGAQAGAAASGSTLAGTAIQEADGELQGASEDAADEPHLEGGSDDGSVSDSTQAPRVAAAAAQQGGQPQPQMAPLKPLLLLRVPDAMKEKHRVAAAAAAAAQPAGTPPAPAPGAAAACPQQMQIVAPSRGMQLGGRRAQVPYYSIAAGAGQLGHDATSAALLGASGPRNSTARRAGSVVVAGGGPGPGGWAAAGGRSFQERRPSDMGRQGSTRGVSPAHGSAFESAAGRAVLDEDALSEPSEDELEDMTHEEYLEECRVSLLAGLKRHFRFKAAEGLLSATSLRLLDYACDACLSKPGLPLDFFKTVAGDIKSRGVNAYLAMLHYNLRRYRASLYRSRSGGFLYWRWGLNYVLEHISVLLRVQLTKVAVTALEVAMELWLALTVSPQARMLRTRSGVAYAILQEELRDQADVVWRFIMDTQIEAPDEFASLQTHRVQLAVARRQLAFVESLAKVGAVEEAAAEALQEMVEHRLHKLEARGPNWQPPSLMDVLRQQPFMADESEGMLLWLRAYGELRSYAPGQCIVPHRRSGPPGVFIVLSGLVRVEVLRAGRVEVHFVGVGGTVGFLSSLLGRDLPGIGLMAAFGQGNALGRGPLVLHLPMRLLAAIQQRANAGDAGGAPAPRGGGGGDSSGAAGAKSGPSLSGLLGKLPASQSGRLVAPPALNAAAFQQLLLDMHRQAGVLLLERMGDSVVQLLAGHIQSVVLAIFEYAAQLPPSKSMARLQRLLEALLGISDLSELGIISSTASMLSEVVLLESEAAFALLQQRAQAAAARLSDLMRTADLVKLEPGQRFRQGATAMLLVGSLQMQRVRKGATSISSSAFAPAAGTGQARGGAVAQQQQQQAQKQQQAQQLSVPTLLAWAPELFADLEEQYSSDNPPTYTAGPRGALLLLSAGYTMGDDGSIDGGNDAPGGGSAAAYGVQPPQPQVQLNRLSSLMPLRRTVACEAEPQSHNVL